MLCVVKTVTQDELLHRMSVYPILALAQNWEWEGEWVLEVGGGWCTWGEARKLSVCASDEAQAHDVPYLSLIHI